MKCIILHESRGRIRVHLAQKHMTERQADIFEQYLRELRGAVTSVNLYERTCDAIICYTCTRAEILAALARFRYNDSALCARAMVNQGRVLNRTYREKLYGMVVSRAVRLLFIPPAVRAVYTVVRSIPYLIKGLRCLLHRRLQVEVLDATSITVSMLRGDFGTAASVMFLLSLGNLLEEWTRKKSFNDLAASMARHVDRVWLRTPDGGEVLTPISQIQANDLICVRTGNLIPLDGKVIEGAATVNQASLTGESVPADKGPGSMVYAGTVVEDGEFVVQVSGSTGTSQYDRIVSMIEESEHLKSSMEKKASRLADRLVPYVLAGSVLTYALTSNITRAVAILMVDFSCALKLSIPLSVLSAMREAGRCHISVKGGKYLESVARADTVVFDKTGTLTHACPTVVEVIPFSGHNKTEMLRIAACLEEHYPHSIANAVVRAAQEQHLDHQEMHAKVEYVVAHGISSTIGKDRIVIGSHHFVFEDEGCTLPEDERQKFDELPEQYSHLYLAIGGVLSAVICIADPLRPEAVTAIQQLRELGISHMVMMTGDSDRAAAAIARQIGVDYYDSEVLPADKANFVKEWQEKGHTVMMVGDGINDSPALSAADVGISISDGAAIAREIADINIAADSLLELVVLRRLSLALVKRIDSNYRTIIGFNGGLIALSALGVLVPSASALLHNLSTLLISLNSMTDLLEEKEPSLLESDF